MVQVHSARESTRSFSPRRFAVGMVALAVVIGALLGTIGLGRDLFRSHEAQTAIYARNLIRLGRLTPWDGTNLVGDAVGAATGQGLGRQLAEPPLPVYAAAAGMTLCGQTTIAGRMPLVLAGVLSIGLLAVWSRRHFGRSFPWWLPSLVLALSPAYLLYVRCCRYYALGVLFTLAALVFWAPGPPPAQRRAGLVLRRRRVLRFAGGVIAVGLLCLTDYLNAVAVLVALPLFFLDRRYRRAEQYGLLGAMCAAALLCGAWAATRADSFAAEIAVAGGSVFDWDTAAARWKWFPTQLWRLICDSGLQELFPWGVVILLPVPWLPTAWLPRRMLRLRRLATRGIVLAAVVLAYLAGATWFMSAGMARGSATAASGVVPLAALGAVMSALVVAMLWRIARWPAVVGFVLLVGTNLLGGGFLAKRSDGGYAWWPPTLCRYVYGIVDDYPTGNEAIVSLLKRLPAGTQVRIWPPQMAYPAMFYVPELRYCDHLSYSQPISADAARGLPEYLFVERSRPEVVLVPAPLLRGVLDDLLRRHGGDSYAISRTLAPYWRDTTVPEIPRHFFSAPPADWRRYPGMVVLVRKGSPLADLEGIRMPDGDAAGHYQLGLTLVGAASRQSPPAAGALSAKLREEAIAHYVAALRLQGEYATVLTERGDEFARRELADAATVHYIAVLQFQPQRADEFLSLANAFTRQEAPERAVPYYRALLWCDRAHVPARVGLGMALSALGEWDLAVRHFRRAIEIEPDTLSAHRYLAETLTKRWKVDEAIEVYRAALRLLGEDADSETARQIRRALDELEAARRELQSTSTYRDEP